MNEYISDEHFQELIDRAFDKLPTAHRDRVWNVAILFADEPTPEQRVQNKLRQHETLFGLYEGVPLSARQGVETYLPDRITLFKHPLVGMAQDEHDLQEEIYHTLWHEIAHYYGLDHDKIRALEEKGRHG